MHHRSSSTTPNVAAVVVVSPPTSGNYPSAVPGRLRRRRRRRGTTTSTPRGAVARLHLGMAVLLWYSLGIISIATSKVLLTNGVSPLVLSLQQFGIGCLVLHAIVHIRRGGGDSSDDTTTHTTTTKNNKNNNNTYLPWASVCFALGFVATNLGFHGAAASVVETVKASEPITSALLAYTCGLETQGWNFGQLTSLASIVAGVVLASSSSSSSSGADDESTTTTTTATPWSAILYVLAANLCFSFRGLFQKLGQQKQQQQDAVRLQLSMQTMGLRLLVVPVVVEQVVVLLLLRRTTDTNSSSSSSWETTSTTTITNNYSSSSSSYTTMLLLSMGLLNGVAFTAYNLASTYILSRLTVVHHAALNCIRRVVAILVTSLLFGIPITCLLYTSPSPRDS